MMRYFTMLAVWVGLWWGSLPGAAGQETKDAEIKAFVETYFRSWSAADFATYRGCFHPEATLDVKSPTGWLRWDLTNFFASQQVMQTRDRATEVPMDIRVLGRGPDTAFVEIAWKLTRGPSTPVTGIDWFTLTKTEAGWKILHLTFWEDPPKQASTQPRPRIVVSGFEPFGGRAMNASSLLAEAIQTAFPQYDITYLKIPVPAEALQLRSNRS